MVSMFGSEPKDKGSNPLTPGIPNKLYFWK